jgi:hypothetical protein
MQQVEQLAPKLGIEIVTPQRLPPGRFRLATRPYFTGSPPNAKTIGMVEVAAFAANTVGPESSATITAT